MRWSWKPEHEKSFRTSKELLMPARVLVHYDPEKELVLSCDASPYVWRCAGTPDVGWL